MTERAVIPVAVLGDAVAVAMKARDGRVTQHEVDGLREKVEELMKGDQSFAPCVYRFCTDYELVRRDPAGLKAAGEALWLAIKVATDRVPAGTGRADIDG
jgi:hypothetical protein